MKQTLGFMECESLHGKSFLDIGCRSGLFSYVAQCSGAQSIFSFDYDPQSVSATEQVRIRAGSPKNCQIANGSLLSKQFLDCQSDSDIVYAWGVLHHTGNTWAVIRNAAKKVKPNGLYYIAIYNKQEYRTLKRWRGSYHWLRVKKRYNSGELPARPFLESFYRPNEVVTMLLRGRNPFNEIEYYCSRRSMSSSVDITVHIGSLSFEFASVDEIFRVCTRELYFELVNIESTISLGCNQYIFRNPA